VPKSTPIVSEDRIYYGCDDNKLRCIDLATGQLLWSFQAKGVTSKGIMSSPAIHEGNIYFGAYNGDVYCLNTRGDLVWRAPLCERIGSSPLILPDHRSLVIGLEYQRPGIKGSLAALDLLTGDKKWEQPLTAYQHGSAEYARSLDRIVYGTNEGRLVAADAGSGETVWEFRTQGEIKYKPAIDEPADLVACASFDGGIYANRLSTGAPVFKVQTSNICYTTPLIHGGRIYCGSGDRFFYVIDAETGEIVKKIDCHGRIFSSPRAVGPHIIFGCNTGQLVELDPVTLSVAGMFQLPDSITNTVTALDHGRRIFVSTYMNDLFSLEHKLE
jgi:outer membrane protein assembly factor BamB